MFRPPPPKGPPKADARQRVLAQWRGVDLAPAERALRHSARAMGDVLPKVLGETRLDQRRAESQIVRIWNAALDPTLTAHAQPHGLTNGTLFVTVDSSVWLGEIVRYRRKEILDRMRTALGSEVIKKISFKVG